MLREPFVASVKRLCVEITPKIRRWTSFLIVGVVILRGRSMYTPFADPTTGLYLHIANAWLHGDIPYTTTWDYRPPGYFAMYALAMFAFGASFARDAMAIASLLVTTLCVGFIGRELSASKDPHIPWISALFFTLLSTVNDAIAGVAELQISAFIATAILVVLRWPRSTIAMVCAGLTVGLAIQCKLSAIPLLIAPMLAIIARSPTSPSSLTIFISSSLVPVVGDIALYGFAHRVSDLWNANVQATARRATSLGSVTEFARNRMNFTHQLLALAPQLEFAPFGLIRRVNSDPLTLIAWIAGSLLAIVAAGEYYERQFVLLTAPIAIL